MRSMRLAALVAAVLLLGLATGAAFAATGGEPGRPESPGRSEAARTGDVHDPDNPDGTYRGKSSSTPDQDGIGADHGIVNNDKTGPGTDGNNGCGNDPDREDDNNGWCGKPEVSATSTATPTVEVSPTGTATTTASPAAQVLGASFERPAEVAGAGLARTGVPVDVVIASAAALLATGLALRTLAAAGRR